MDAADDIAFLAASEHRGTVLEALYRDAPLTRGELADRSGAARVTVGRNLEKFGDRGIAREGPDGFELTALGDALAAAFVAMAETVTAADHLAPVLRHVPRDSFDLDVRELADADVTVSTRANPYAPVARHERTLREADRARVVLPATGPEPLSTVAERAVDGELETEMIVSTDVADAFRSAEYRDDVEHMLRADAATAMTYGGEVPYYLGLVDDTVQIGVDDAEGIPRALAESDAGFVRSWAEDTYDAFRSASESFDVEG